MENINFIPIIYIRFLSYVKNKEYELKDQPHEVAGMLLYAGQRRKSSRTRNIR